MTSDTYFHISGVASVRWDAPNSAVLVEWEGWANTAEFRALLDSEIKALKDHGGSRLLADCRRQRVLKPGRPGTREPRVDPARDPGRPQAIRDCSTDQRPGRGQPARALEPGP